MSKAFGLERHHSRSICVDQYIAEYLGLEVTERGPRHIIVSAEYGHMVKKLLKVTQSEVLQLVVIGNLRHRI